MPRTDRTLQLHQCSVCDRWKLKLNEEKSKLAGLAQQFFAKIAEAGRRRTPSLTSAREECNKYNLTAHLCLILTTQR